MFLNQFLTSSFDMLLAINKSEAMDTTAVASNRPTEALALVISFTFVVYSHYKHS